MQEKFYAHSLYRVQEGKTAEFIAAWEKFDQALTSAGVTELTKGILIQNQAEPLLFHSFGGRHSLEPITGLQQNEQVRQALLGMASLSQHIEQGFYRTVRQINHC